MARYNNRRGQIPTAITWIASLLVVVFAAALFLAATSTLAGFKKPSFSSSARTDSTSGNSAYLPGSLEMQNAFFSFLESSRKIGGKDEVMWEAIASLKLDEKERVVDVQNEIKKFVSGLEKKPNCYLFKGDVLDMREVKGMSAAQLMSAHGNVLLFYWKGEYKNLTYYIGECPND